MYFSPINFPDFRNSDAPPMLRSATCDLISFENLMNAVAGNFGLAGSLSTGFNFPYRKARKLENDAVWNDMCLVGYKLRNHAIVIARCYAVNTKCTFYIPKF